MKKVTNIFIKAWNFYVEQNTKLYKPLWENGLVWV